MMYASGILYVSDQGGPKAGNIERGGIVSGAIPATAGVRASEPGSPLIDGPEVSGRAIGVGRLTATRAGMRGLARLLPFQPDASQVAFVSEHAPQLASNLRIVAPIPPLATGIFAPPGGLHRLERLSSNQLA